MRGSQRKHLKHEKFTSIIFEEKWIVKKDNKLEKIFFFSLNLTVVKVQIIKNRQVGCLRKRKCVKFDRERDNSRVTHKYYMYMYGS